MRKKKPAAVVQLPRSERLAIANAADCDERVVTNLLRGEPVKSRSAMRARAELLKRGLLPEAAQ